ncbi:MAG TPA: SurA N-terminal domain-containing protein [Candidatus Angelobacter sp.]|nr:SurA N-terminal domain-containing protein [Candidatus Angelobacter sp.]
MSAYKNWSKACFFLFLLSATLTFTCCSSRGGGADANVMAQVNGYKVLRSELDKAYNTQVAGSPQKPTSTQEEGLRLQTLDQIMQTRLILQRAEKLGIKTSNDDVEARLTKAKASFTVEQFQKKLKDIGLTEDDFKTYLQHELTIEKVIEKEITPKLSVPDADVNAFYERNKAQIPPSADESEVKRQIREKLRSELAQVLKAAYQEELRNGAEIHNYYAEELLKNHKVESKTESK